MNPVPARSSTLYQQHLGGLGGIGSRPPEPQRACVTVHFFSFGICGWLKYLTAQCYRPLYSELLFGIQGESGCTNELKMVNAGEFIADESGSQWEKGAEKGMEWESGLSLEFSCLWPGSSSKWCCLKSSCIHL